MFRRPPMVFGCTALVGSNKAGLLKADANGYYEMVLGALNFNNSVGQTYPEAPALELLKQSSSFMRRVANGYCRGEYGHPKKQPGMTFQDYMRRILTIEESMVSHHIKEVWIDKTRVSNGNRPVVAIMGKLKPVGPYATALERSLDNPDENVAFSIRSITDDYRNGARIEKHLREIVCWDFVNEPGISVANKYQAPSLESFNEDFLVEESMLHALVANDAASGVNIGFEAADVIKSILHSAEKRQTIKIAGGAPSSGWKR